MRHNLKPHEKEDILSQEARLVQEACLRVKAWLMQVEIISACSGIKTSSSVAGSAYLLVHKEEALLYDG